MFKFGKPVNGVVPIESVTVLDQAYFDRTVPRLSEALKTAQAFSRARLLRKGVPADVVLGINLDKRWRISDANYGRKDGSAISDPLKNAVRQVENAVSEVESTAHRRQVVISDGESPEAVDEAEKALLADGVGLYQRGGEVVRVGRIDDDHSGSSASALLAGSLAIFPVNAHNMREQFCRHVEWVKATKAGYKRAEPTLAHAQMYLSRPGHWRLPVLRGICEAPTLRRDGSVVEKPGYDDAGSGFYCDFGSAAFPPVPSAPTKEDAAAALDRITRLLAGFPFVPDDEPEGWMPARDEGLRSSTNRSVALSALLTGLVRRSINTAPLHAFEAPDKGTGKSLLADLVSILQTGREAVSSTWSGDPPEVRKSLFAMLREGRQTIVLDNIETPLEGAALCTVLTQRTWQDRVLAKSETQEVPTNCLFIANGNNLVIRGDLSRRVVIARLDARVERPDLRQFDFDPREMARQHRGALVVAGLTILRAYRLAGDPMATGMSPMGGFEDWGWVRGALVWLGQPDPAGSRERVMREDPAKSQLAEMMEAWWAVFGDRPMILGDALARAFQADSDEEKRLLRCFAEICRERAPNAKSLGWWFRSYADRVVAGRKFVRREQRNRGALVTLVGPAAQGELGFAAE